MSWLRLARSRSPWRLPRHAAPHGGVSTYSAHLVFFFRHVMELAIVLRWYQTYRKAGEKIFAGRFFGKASIRLFLRFAGGYAYRIGAPIVRASAHRRAAVEEQPGAVCAKIVAQSVSFRAAKSTKRRARGGLNRRDHRRRHFSRSLVAP